MTQLIAYNTLGPYERQPFFLSLPRLDALPLQLDLPSPHFVCLLACDATHETDEQLHTLADGLLSLGVAYLCAWGPDCERVHDVFDLTAVQQAMQVEGEYPIMTTWHRDETLDHALWFALDVAYPDEMYAATCRSTLVVSVANPTWDAHLQRRLANMQQWIDAAGK